MVTKKLLVQMNMDIFLVEFDVNPNESENEASVILGRNFLRHAKGVVDFTNGLLTIYPNTDGIRKNFWKLNTYASEMNEKN